MKACVAALALPAVLLIVSQGLVQNPADAPKPKQKESLYAEIAKAPEKARAKRNPLETDSQAVAAGRILFEQHCSECHGDSAEGGKKGPNLRAEEIQSAAPGAIFWILTNGVVRRGMPVWSKLPEPQRWQLVSYLKSLGAQPVAPPATPPSPSAPARQPTRFL
ncbi:MAG TPA: c-type cytochrome [Candidatus Dormibacteraeota bacterium]|nr:c-type cytochrome [Candidatus Dormibacteraeota bacterium]